MIERKPISILGDVHLGKQFVHNVPLHRRGERERQMWSKLADELNPNGTRLHVNMGDLFDKPIVSLGVIKRAAEAYINAAINYPKAMFVILRGNHDASKDLEMVTAFDIFTRIVIPYDNIVVVDNVFAYEGMLFFGWDAVRPAAEIVKAAPVRGSIAFGHWDVDARSDPFNLIPIAELRALGVTEVYTGHDHLRRELMIDGMPVHVVGSMLPYAHGEDADGTTYVTLTLDEARERAAELRDKCVRIDLQPGETYDLDLDCLQLQVRRVSDDAESIEVELGEFNLGNIFDECMADVPAGVLEQVRDEWNKAFNAKR